MGKCKTSVRIKKTTTPLKHTTDINYHKKNRYMIVFQFKYLLYMHCNDWYIGF